MIIAVRVVYLKITQNSMNKTRKKLSVCFSGIFLNMIEGGGGQLEFFERANEKMTKRCLPFSIMQPPINDGNGGIHSQILLMFGDV